MSQGYQQAITHVLQQDSKVLGVLLSKLNQLAQMNELLAKHLDKKLLSHCQVANYSNECLTLITDNALWATQIRFVLPLLLSKLKEHAEFAQLKSIVCKINPQIGTREIQVPEFIRTMPKISLPTARIILDTANSIQHDKLKCIMQKIAQNT